MEIVVDDSFRVPSLSERVAHVLRVNIVSGRLPPGEHLVESSLADQFGVSRGPVRDALRQLEVEGLTESNKGRYYVIGISDDDIEELYTLRIALEALALRLCMDGPLASDGAVGGEIVDMEQTIAKMHRAAEESSPQLFAEADIRFHSLFYEAAGNTRLLNVWEQLRPTFKLLMDTSTEQDADLKPSARAHEVLLETVRGGDQKATMELLEQHLAGSKQRIVVARRGRSESANAGGATAN